VTRPSRLLRTVVETPGAVQIWHWGLISAVILLVDYLTGPYIQFPILFIVPVALATAGHGLIGGMSVAALLPSLRLLLFLVWPVPVGWPLEAADTLVDLVILCGFALLVDRILRQEREIRVLEGMLPICSFCKRIRQEDGSWRQLESYISERSGARFSHTFCVECGRRHYPGIVD
jgi:hypothetical protein